MVGQSCARRDKSQGLACGGRLRRCGGGEWWRRCGGGEWWRAGGPSGGNGGQGGNVWAVADESLNSLSSFRRQVAGPPPLLPPFPPALHYASSLDCGRCRCARTLDWYTAADAVRVWCALFQHLMQGRHPEGTGGTTVRGCRIALPDPNRKALENLGLCTTAECGSDWSAGSAPRVPPGADLVGAVPSPEAGPQGGRYGLAGMRQRNTGAPVVKGRGGAQGGRCGLAGMRQGNTGAAVVMGRGGAGRRSTSGPRPGRRALGSRSSDAEAATRWCGCLPAPLCAGPARCQTSRPWLSYWSRVPPPPPSSSWGRRRQCARRKLALIGSDRQPRSARRQVCCVASGGGTGRLGRLLGVLRSLRGSQRRLLDGLHHCCLQSAPPHLSVAARPPALLVEGQAGRRALVGQPAQARQAQNKRTLLLRGSAAEGRMLAGGNGNGAYGFCLVL